MVTARQILLIAVDVSRMGISHYLLIGQDSRKQIPLVLAQKNELDEFNVPLDT